MSYPHLAYGDRYDKNFLYGSFFGVYMQTVVTEFSVSDRCGLLKNPSGGKAIHFRLDDRHKKSGKNHYEPVRCHGTSYPAEGDPVHVIETVADGDRLRAARWRLLART